MADSAKVTVLLADEDSMRRDGLASVLKDNPEIEIVAGCPDGIAALEEIRELRPEVAVVDLNLPGLHGIELVRRIRGESLGTKVIILAGTTDDDIVREVVRAGADAYLLKNGPVRHLTDAINYVRDGGQYFSPQLRRDGRDRHLLEEPPRIPPDRVERRAEGSGAEWPYRERRSVRRTADPERFRERLREETSRDLRERDYEIMSEMADGIRPILDRLDEIENRVMEMEDGAEPVPADPRGWLSAQLADTLSGPRTADRGSSARFSARDVEQRLPELIEEAVSKRFQSMAGKLQEEIEEQHVRTLETFVKNIQTKLVQRVSVLEQNMSQQAEAMNQLREYNQRTEDNLGRLISGVDKLAQELPKRLAAAQAETTAEPPVRDEREGSRREKEKRGGHSGSSRKRSLVPVFFWAAVLVIAAIGGYWYHQKGSGDATAAAGATAATGEAGSADGAAAAPKAAAVPAGADTNTKLDAAKQYMDRKEYKTAEDIYRQVVQAEPNNVDALKGLASVLYREDRIEESTEVLGRLPKN